MHTHTHTHTHAFSLSIKLENVKKKKKKKEYCPCSKIPLIKKKKNDESRMVGTNRINAKTSAGLVFMPKNISLSFEKKFHL